jgi:elongation factor P
MLIAPAVFIISLLSLRTPRSLCEKNQTETLPKMRFHRFPPRKPYLCCPKTKIINQNGAFFMANTSDISRGMILKLENRLYTVVEFGENKTARAAAKVWAKLKGLDNSRSIEHTWNSGDNIYPVRVERKPFQYLYKEENSYSFMDNETFEQLSINAEMIDAPQFLKEGQEVSVLMNTETELPMSVELPDKIVLLVTYTEPGLRGDTATRTLKPSTVETGATVMVPLFVEEGELIRINTKTGEYVERVKE